MHRLFPALACAAALTLAACGGADDAEMVDTGMGTVPPAPAAGPMTDAGMAGQGLVADTEAAANALEGGVANVPLETAGPLLERIQNQLASTGDATLGEVATDLGNLRTALTGGTASGAEIGRMLSDIGGKVTTYAGTAPDGARALLQRLGTALTNQGNELAGG